MRVPLLLSYNYVRLDVISCEVSHEERLHEVTGASGVDATFWFSRHVAFDVRLLGFVGALHRAEGGPYPVSETHFVFGLNVGLGVALPL
ncbi:MAG TPA: hypothetical protein VLB44_21435 [Kofleriaceae bacterium]|nr:hypothetical protein [Kofleriaceae bacterium]